jgi:hypothetical protein
MTETHPGNAFTHFRVNGLLFRITVRSHNADPKFRVWGRCMLQCGGYTEQNFPSSQVEYLNA